MWSDNNCSVSRAGLPSAVMSLRWQHIYSSPHLHSTPFPQSHHSPSNGQLDAERDVCVTHPAHIHLQVNVVINITHSNAWVLTQKLQSGMQSRDQGKQLKQAIYRGDVCVWGGWGKNSTTQQSSQQVKPQQKLTSSSTNSI